MGRKFRWDIGRSYRGAKLSLVRKQEREIQWHKIIREQVIASNKGSTIVWGIHHLCQLHGIEDDEGEEKNAD